MDSRDRVHSGHRFLIPWPQTSRPLLELDELFGEADPKHSGSPFSLPLLPNDQSCLGGGENPDTPPPSSPGSDDPTTDSPKWPSLVMPRKNGLSPNVVPPPLNKELLIIWGWESCRPCPEGSNRGYLEVLVYPRTLDINFP